MSSAGWAPPTIGSVEYALKEARKSSIQLLSLKTIHDDYPLTLRDNHAALPQDTKVVG